MQLKTYLLVVNYSDIEAKLNRLDVEYNKNILDPDLPIFYSKLAVIEFSGWMEDSVDTIVYDYINAHILASVVKKQIEKYVKGNFGFNYYSNLFKVFTSVLGVNTWENIEDKLKPKNFANLVNVTSTYTGIRNKAAHSSVVVTNTFSSPSATIAAYNKIKPAMMMIEHEVAAL